MNNERLKMAFEIARRAMAHDDLIAAIEKQRVMIGHLHDQIDGQRETLHKTYDVWKASRAKQGLPADFSDIPASEWPPECMGDYRPPRINAKAAEDINKLLAGLSEALEFIEGQEDSADGPEGQPQPNRAMQLADTLRAILATAGAPA
jgi:hypothetical protein